jgi:hypothetical protein
LNQEWEKSRSVIRDRHGNIPDHIFEGLLLVADLDTVPWKRDGKIRILEKSGSKKNIPDPQHCFEVPVYLPHNQYLAPPLFSTPDACLSPVMWAMLWIRSGFNADPDPAFSDTDPGPGFFL